MNNLVNLFFDLVKIDSPTGHEDEIADFVVKFLKKRNVKTEVDSFGNIIAKIEGNGDPLFLSAHLDTVEPGRSIKPVEENGILKSSTNTILGADNKVALAALLQMVDEVGKKDLNCRPIDLVFTKNEEAENLGAINLDYKAIDAKSGFIFDASRPVGTIILASPYYLRFDIEIIGNSAHASAPDEASNAVLVFADAMKKIKLGKIDTKTIANIGVVNSGHVRNTIPGEMKISGEVRSFKKGSVENVVDSMIKEFKKSAKKYGSIIKTDVVLENPGYVFNKSDEVVKHAEKAMRLMDINPSTEWYQGCSDANIFVENDIKTLNLGNGSYNAHTFEEEITVKDFEKFYRLILSLISQE